MNSLPKLVSKKLINPVYKRKNKSNVDITLKALGVSASSIFKLFYELYEGPFGSEVTGFEVVDLFECEPNEQNIISLTKICREEYQFPNKFLVLTELLGGGVLVYDTENDCVFNVDFEGSDQDLINGTLEPDWSSFYEFLDFYFW